MMRNKWQGKFPLLHLAGCLMVGIVIGADESGLPGFWGWFVFAGSLIIACLLWNHPLFQSGAIAVCFLGLGTLLVQEQRKNFSLKWPEGEVVYEAVVMSNPVEKPKTMAVDILLAESGRLLKCYLYKDERSKNLRVGDGLRIQSRICENRNWRVGTFDYRRYLEVHGFTGTTFVSSRKWRKAQVSLASISHFDRTKLFFQKWRNRLLERLSPTIGGEAYAVIAAMTLGDKSALTSELRDIYSVTGASHVLALSGLHLGIIYTLLSFFVVGRRCKALSQVMLILGVWGFVLIVGMSVSIMRSALMLSVYALLSLGHRDRMSVNTLAFTAIVLLVINPLSLFDVGFQLSFVAVLAILVWMPLFERAFSWELLMSHRVLKWAWGMVAVSCAAQIGVAPLIAYYFGRFSCYFLLTNFIVIPAATLILYLTVIVIAFPTHAYLLLYIGDGLNAILSYIAKLPGASIEGLHPTLLQTAMVYVIIVAFYGLVYIAAPAVTDSRANEEYR